jgi:hypothetical protein
MTGASGLAFKSWPDTASVSWRDTLLSPVMLLSIFKMVMIWSLVLICYRDTLNNQLWNSFKNAKICHSVT